MKSILVFFALCIFFILAPGLQGQDEQPVDSEQLPEQLLTNLEWNLLDDLLTSMNLRRRDTEFDKKLADGRFRLDSIVQMLDRPMHAPDASYQMVKNISEARLQCESLMREACHLLEVNTVSDIVFPERVELNDLAATWTKEQLREWNNLPVVLQQAVLYLYHGSKQAQQHITQAFTDLTEKEMLQIVANIQQITDDANVEVLLVEESWQAHQLESKKEFYDIIERIDWVEYCRAALWLSAACDRAEASLQSWLHSGAELSLDSMRLDSPFGAIVLAGDADHIHREDVFILIDTGGRDTYLNRAGSAMGAGLGQQISILIDCAGNDMYSSGKNFSVGSGFLGIGMHLDLAGDDVYQSMAYSQGCGLAGFGLHVDRAGDDVYRAAEVAQGAGSIGIGILSNDAGNDSFTGARYVQGFAFVKAIGILTTGTGNDVYYAGGVHSHAPLLPDRYQCLSQGFSIGDRGNGIAGGIGILHDSAGNDRYLSDVFGQGAGYWYALGILMDEQGNDDYISSQYSQGSGIHLAVGSLIDLNGNDTYTATLGLAQGGTHDLSVGVLVDKNGNDKYQGNTTMQGSALSNAVAIFIDAKGDDIYSSTGDADQGGGRAARGFGSIGMFLDTSGDDRYPAGKENNQHWLSGKWGAGMDIEAYPKTSEEERE